MPSCSPILASRVARIRLRARAACRAAAEPRRIATLLVLLCTACGQDGDEDGTAIGAIPPEAANAAAVVASAPAATHGAAPVSIVCEPPSGSPAPAAAQGDMLEADTPGSDGTRMFALTKPFTVAITTRTARDGQLVWQVRDERGAVRGGGRFAITSGTKTWTLRCRASRAGYFALSAGLAPSRANSPERGGDVPEASGALPARGTRPAGIATFGVLPELGASLPPPTYARQDQHRFGGQGTNYLRPGQHCCDGDGYRPLYPALGLSWANDNRNWYMLEPKQADRFEPGVDTLAPYFRKGDIMRLIQLDGLPGWASPTGERTHSYAPVSEAQYRDYMRRVGTDSALIRTAYFPSQSSNYYQVTWEPDYTGGLPWRDTDAHFVALYRATYESIHATDPHAVVMGTANASVRENTRWLARLAPLGLGRYLDGMAIHGYYDTGCSPSHPPERLATSPNPAIAANALPASMRELRGAMVKYLKPGAKLFATETGVSYDVGTSYGPAYPSREVLFAHGAVVARTHLILLGEGADMTYIFYSSDTPDAPPGYGLFFDLSNPKGSYGSGAISPKPAAMAVAAMTRIVDGTTTIGRLNGLPAGVYGYAFQRLGGGKIVTALWAHDNDVWSASAGFSATYGVRYTLQVDDDGTSGTVTLLDAMGNPASMRYANGRIALALSEEPLYVVSANAAVARAHATAPAGYMGERR